eukprot:1166744-Amphidinium_carterae.1
MAACTEAVSMLPSFKDSLRPQATSELESLVTGKIGSEINAAKAAKDAAKAAELLELTSRVASIPNGQARYKELHDIAQGLVLKLKQGERKSKLQVALNALGQMMKGKEETESKTRLETIQSVHTALEEVIAQRDDIDSEMQALIKSSSSLLISMTEVTLVDSARLAKNGKEKDVKCEKVETRLRESTALLNVLTVLVAQ